MIEYIGQINFINNEYNNEIAIMLKDKGYLLEPIYTNKLICGYKVYEKIAELQD